jgi:hypothetical protein
MSADERPEPVRQADSPRQHEPAERLGELLRLWRAGLGGIRQRKLLWLALMVFTPGWLIAVYNWAALPLARPWQLAVVAATGLVLIALPAAALWLIFRGISWAALITAQGYTTVVLWALLGVWLPWQIVWWVIPFESATLEGVLAAIRFIAADALFGASLLWLGRVLARPGSASGDELREGPVVK